MRVDLRPQTFDGSLARLVEEAAEVQIECAHIARFGRRPTDAKTGIRYDNVAALLSELDDLEDAMRETRRLLASEEHAP